ncbi:DUF2127 domain-containing protein [Pelagicoccus sp. SDUM812002]|uniref:DUF2127 domain-containing protein n=1 Tax=Pelagicoccus sp. SDUM812002 TaxID=3041266 RepID=UPI00280F985B|nr:DUF2127 domain-containing protein [Pelagicoccus sp. SDUM812002]MDQ8184668.1 DUF2127 domain-containing protein [Pelagicoccus sp. SDUM812002]
MQPRFASKGLKAVAVLEITKGLFAILGAAWLLYTLGQNWEIALSSMIERFAPSLALPGRISVLLAGFNNERQTIAAIALLAYGVLHSIEGYGLWLALHWAEWLGTISGGIYIPFEIWEMFEHPSWFTATVLVINILIVAYLIYVIKTNPRHVGKPQQLS